MPIRCKLGPPYVLSPAQRVEKWAISNISKLIFTLVIWVLWFCVFFVFLGVINFVGANVAGMWDKETTVMDFFVKPYSIAVFILGMVFIVIYVFYDKTSRRK
jgi:uncharacterized BrkB/YihY/UPF0761 family membrane protein